MSLYREVPFKRWHLTFLEEQGDAEGGMAPPLDLVTLRWMETQNSATLLYDDVVLACGGTLAQWPGRHLAWAYLNATTGRHMTYITRGARRVIERAQGRVEFSVRRDFAKGHRWARMLGFDVENFPGTKIEEYPADAVVPGLLRRYGPEGEDHVAYVRFVG